MTEKVANYVEELIGLATEALEARDQSIDSTQSYKDLFIESVIALDGYLKRKEMAEMFNVSEDYLNLLVFRYKAKNR